VKRLEKEGMRREKGGGSYAGFGQCSNIERGKRKGENLFHHPVR
jgi:hypothetical protein